MGYDTYFEGEIYYGDLPRVNKQVIEKFYDAIQLLRWHADAYSGPEGRINFYPDSRAEWMHFVYGFRLDKERKILDLNGSWKNYHRSFHTFIHFLAPWFDPSKIYAFRHQGEEAHFSEEEENQWVNCSVKGGKLFIEEEEFQTDNIFGFSFPAVEAPRVQSR